MDHSVFIEATETLAEHAKMRRNWEEKYPWRARAWKKKISIPNLTKKIEQLKQAIQVQDTQRAQATNWIERTWLACSQSYNGYRLSLEYYQRALLFAQIQQTYQQQDLQAVIQLHQQQPLRISKPVKLKMTESHPSWFTLIFKLLKGEKMPSLEKIKLESTLLKFSNEAYLKASKHSEEDHHIKERTLTKAEHCYQQFESKATNSEVKTQLADAYKSWKQAYAKGWQKQMNLLHQKRKLDVYHELAVMGCDDMNAVNNDPAKLKRVFLQAQCQLNVMVLHQWFQQNSDWNISAEASKLHMQAHAKLAEVYQLQHKAMTKQKISKEEKKSIIDGIVDGKQMIYSAAKQESEYIRLLDHTHAQLLLALQSEEANNGDRVQETIAHLSVLVVIGEQKTSHSKMSAAFASALNKMKMVVDRMSRINNLVAACNEAEKLVKKFVVVVEEQKSIFLDRFVLAMRQIRKDYADVLSNTELETEIGISAEDILIARQASAKAHVFKQIPCRRGDILKFDSQLNFEMDADDLDWAYKLLCSELTVDNLYEKLTIYIHEFMQAFAKKTENHFQIMFQSLNSDPTFINLQKNFNKAANEHFLIHHSDRFTQNERFSEYHQRISDDSTKRVTNLKAQLKDYLNLGAQVKIEMIEWKKSPFATKAAPTKESLCESEYRLCFEAPGDFKKWIDEEHSTVNLREYRIQQFQNKIDIDIPPLRLKQKKELEKMEQEIADIQKVTKQYEEERKQIREERAVIQQEIKQDRIEKERALAESAHYKKQQVELLKKIAVLEAQLATKEKKKSSNAKALSEFGVFNKDPVANGALQPILKLEIEQTALPGTNSFVQTVM